MKISLKLLLTLLILATNLYCQGTDPVDYGFSKNWKYLKSVSMKMGVGYSDVKFQGPNNGLWIVKMADTLNPLNSQDTMYFYHTSDLGTTWEKRYALGLEGRPFWSKTDFKNHVVIHAQIMIKSTNNNPRKSKIFISRDDAKTFQTYEFDYLDSLYKLDKPNPSIYILNDSTYCLTTHQMVMISTDFGVTWKKCNLPYNGTKYYNIKNSCVVGNNIYLFCAFNQIYKSSDLGETWSLVSNNENLPFYNRKLYCKNDNEFFVLGGFWNKEVLGWKDTLFYSKNAGKTWDTIKNVRNATYENIVSRGEKCILNGGSKGSYYSDDNFKTIKYLGDSTVENPLELGLLGFDIINDNYAIASTVIQGMVWLLDLQAVGVYTPIYLPPILLYPNPLPRSSSLNIRFKEFENYSNLNFKIIDINGKVIDEFSSKGEQQNILHQFTPDKNITSGIYFLVIESSGKIIAKEKFVIE